MDPGTPWLGRLPVDAPFVVAAAVGIVLAVALRRLAAQRLASFLRAAHAAESIFLALLLATMLVLSFLQIVLRNVASTGLIWIDPLLRHLVLWIGFAGAALATRLGRHISIDAVSRFLPDAWQRGVRVASCALASVVCLLLANACLKALRGEAEAGTHVFLDLSTAHVQIVMPAAMLLMSYRFASQVLDALRRAPEAEPQERPA